MRRITALLALTSSLTACADAPGRSSSIASLAPSPTVAASTAEAVPSAESSTTVVGPLEGVLPRELNGVELHTFAVGEDILGRLATRFGVAPDELETAFASEHGARFLQMYAIRLPGTTADELAEGWSLVAYPPEAASDVAIAGETIGGTPITVVDSPSTRSRLGTFYLDRRGDTLIVVQSFDFNVAVEALASLP